MILNIANATVNAMADALSVLMDNGTMECYEGTMPLNADTAISTQVLLATIAIPADAAPAAIDGVLDFNGIPWSAVAVAAGDLQFARIKNSVGEVIFDGDIGLTDAIFVSPIITVAIGDAVKVTTLNITAPK